LFFQGVIVREESAVASVFRELFSSHFSARWSTTRGSEDPTESNPTDRREVPELNATTRIYVDADACPVKDEIYRIAIRHALPVSVVAGNFIRVPQDPLIERIAAGSGIDAADDWIAERAGKGDIVITSDIPLASRCVKAGAEVTGGPKSYSPRDRSAFLSALDQTIRRIQRQRAEQPAPNQG